MPLNETRRNMHLIRHLPETSARPTAVAIGNFDGLHRGHAAVIDAMMGAARENDLLPSVLTFEPHPRRFFAPSLPNFRIERLGDKLRRLKSAGVERVVMPRFNAAFSRISAEAFLETVLARNLQAKAVVTGDDFAFGHQRRGDRAMLHAWGASHGVTIITLPPVKVGVDICSSSAIRAAITAGDMAQAAALLGHPYRLTGRVVHGQQRGRTIGFPTANVALPPNLLLPAYGVYAVRAMVHGEWHDGVANFGIRPTVTNDAAPTLEVHLLTGADDLYGARMEVQWMARVRDEMRFDGIDALKQQITRDVAAARAILMEHV